MDKPASARPSITSPSNRGVSHAAKQWLPVRTEDGSFTLAHPGHGQCCHSEAGAWEEARQRYAAACRLRERAVHEGRLALLDIGTGLGLNLAAALECVRGTRCRLDVLTLELDRGVLEAALALFGRERDRLDPALAQAWGVTLGALAHALERGPQAPVEWEGGALRLVLGDARASLPALSEQRFDAVFLDAFSPRVEPELWSAPFLSEVARRMAPGSLLSTYTSALGVRVALAAAGLRVGSGPRVGTKASGTLASPDLELPALEARLVRRIARRAGRPAGNPSPGGTSLA